MPPVILARARSRLITPPALEPLTLDEAKIWIGVDWPAGDPREPMLQTVIAAARAHVEDETTLALLTQTRDIFIDDAASGAGIVLLPPICRPVQSIDRITWTDDTGTEQPIDPTWYTVQPGTAFVTLTAAFASPSAPLTIRAIVGWPTPADLTAAEPRLIHLVGRLVAHNMTIGRDLAIPGALIEVPMGYDAEIQPYRPQTVV
jgi:uncharacterized phiE125 gp8 family phage protein